MPKMGGCVEPRIVDSARSIVDLADNCKFERVEHTTQCVQRFKEFDQQPVIGFVGGDFICCGLQALRESRDCGVAVERLQHLTERADDVARYFPRRFHASSIGPYEA